MFTYRKHKDTKLGLNAIESMRQVPKAKRHKSAWAKEIHVAKQLMPT
jgi:hypothetical protein